MQELPISHQPVTYHPCPACGSTQRMPTILRIPGSILSVMRCAGRHCPVVYLPMSTLRPRPARLDQLERSEAHITRFLSSRPGAHWRKTLSEEETADLHPPPHGD